MVPEVFSGVSTHIHHQYVIIILTNPIITNQLIYNNTDKGMAIKVDLGGLLAYNRFKILLKNVFKTVRAIKERVIGEICKYSRPGGNIFNLISKAPPNAAKS